MAVDRWFIEAEIQFGERRQPARRPSREQQMEMRHKLLGAIKARGRDASPGIIIPEAHVNRSRAYECLRQLAKEGHYNGFKRSPRHSGKTRR
jgi:hypothetical protein